MQVPSKAQSELFSASQYGQTPMIMEERRPKRVNYFILPVFILEVRTCYSLLDDNLMLTMLSRKCMMANEKSGVLLCWPPLSLSLMVMVQVVALACLWALFYYLRFETVFPYHQRVFDCRDPTLAYPNLTPADVIWKVYVSENLLYCLCFILPPFVVSTFHCLPSGSIR